MAAIGSAIRRGLRSVRDFLVEHRRGLAFLAACLLAFLGPTYGIYALNKLGLPWPFPDILGFAALAAGLLAIAILLPREGGG